MRPTNCATKRQIVKITPRGGDGDPDMLRKFFQRSEFRLLKVSFDAFLSFFSLHFRKYDRF
jgi:hypothetical protein